MTNIDIKLELPENMTLLKSIEEGNEAINLFANNKFDESKNIMIPLQKVSVYHALGYSAFTCLEALFTFKKEDFIKACQVLDSSIQVCEKFKKKFSFTEKLGNIFTKINYNEYTELQVHTDLCFCEISLMRAAMTFLEDESLSSFIKGALKVRNAYNIYKQCGEILTIEKWNEWTTKPDFETGVKLGLGCFNVLIAMLPPSTIKLLEFFGFSGNEETGLQQLEEGSNLVGLRRPFCIIIFLTYHLFVVFMLTYYKGDLEKCENLIKAAFETYNKGMVYLFLQGRLEFMKGNLDDSINLYLEMWKSQDIWPQIHCFAFWELTCLYCLKQDWENAKTHIQNLIDASNWSQCTYSYLKASILIMMKDDAKNKLEINELLKKAPQFKQRIAGKSIPAEKFVVRRAERYFEQSEILFLPMYEFLYLWNLFKLLGTNQEIGNKILKDIEVCLKELDVPEPLTKYDFDNKALLLLLKGSCLRELKSYDESLNILEEIIALEKQIIDDKYILPYALAEKALIQYEKENKVDAVACLEKAKSYSGFPLENRLNFRIKSALSEFQKT